MPVITVFNGSFCRQDKVAGLLSAPDGFPRLTDEDVVGAAAEISGGPVSKISRAFTARTSVFNNFTHEKECSIALLKLALAQRLGDENLLVTGFSGHLIPKSISHVLRVCLIGNTDFRIHQAVLEGEMTEKEAARYIRKADEDASAWTNRLFQQPDPWHKGLYDIVIPMHVTTDTSAADLIEKNANADILTPTASSIQAVENFKLAAAVETALSMEGHNVDVSADAGAVSLTINKHVLMLGRLEDELTEIVEKVAGVKEVKTSVGKDFHKSNIYRKHDFRVPSRVLLVDDEREFVQTLSERLLLRNMGSAMVYDGESALNLIEDDAPDVMIIDLKMPGIDGLEVIKQVKKTRPKIEIIVLTGHGSEADRQRCMSLGAFDYLQKPVDFELLSEALKRAHDKIGKTRPCDADK
ncbi:MAG: response regulator [Desulfobacteraceae bacterium]|nr:response regulator [Desulfobacteraceae bacterium]